MEGYKKVGIYWKPEKGESIKGIYTKLTEGFPSAFGFQTHLELTKEDGTNISVPVSAGLENLVRKLDIGDDIMIQYLGEEVNPKTNRTFRKFEVYKK